MKVKVIRCFRGWLLVFFALLLLSACLAAPVRGPVRAAEEKTLSILFFGCQDGYLKPCG